MTTKQKAKGFTIVELLFSTAIFSAVLLLCLSALVQIGRMYYKGVTTAQTQQTARALLDEISQTMQFTGAQISPITDLAGNNVPELGGPIIPPGSSTSIGYFCVGQTRYTYAMDRMQSDTNDFSKKKIRHAMWVDEPGFCAGADALVLYTAAPVDLTADQPSASQFNGRDLLSQNMRLTRMSMTKLATDGSIWMVRLTVAYGDDDLLMIDPQDSSRRYCKGAYIGAEFCAFSELSTIVKRRVQ